MTSSHLLELPSLKDLILFLFQAYFSTFLLQGCTSLKTNITFAPKTTEMYTFFWRIHERLKYKYICIFDLLCPFVFKFIHWHPSCFFYSLPNLIRYIDVSVQCLCNHANRIIFSLNPWTLVTGCYLNYHSSSFITLLLGYQTQRFVWEFSTQQTRLNHY